MQSLWPHQAVKILLRAAGEKGAPQYLLAGNLTGSAAAGDGTAIILKALLYCCFLICHET